MKSFDTSTVVLVGGVAGRYLLRASPYSAMRLMSVRNVLTL